MNADERGSENYLKSISDPRFSAFICGLFYSRDSEDHEETALEAQVAVAGIVPFVEGVGAAGGATGAERDCRDAERDWQIRIGRGLVQDRKSTRLNSGQ